MFHTYQKRTISLEGKLARNEQVKHDTECVNVRCWLSLLALEPLWSHISRCPIQLSRGSQPGRGLIDCVGTLIEKVYNTKIDQVHFSLLINEHIAGFDITMYDPMLMSIINGTRELVQIPCNFL